MIILYKAGQSSSFSLIELQKDQRKALLSEDFTAFYVPKTEFQMRQ